MATEYQRPGWFTTHIINPVVSGLTRVGLSLAVPRVLEVRGRRSGEWRSTPVNPLEFRTEEFTATELADEQKLPLLRAYL